MTKPKPDIEETFRQLFENHAMPVSDADWAGIRSRVQPKRRIGWFWILPLSLLLSTIALLWWNKHTISLPNPAARATVATMPATTIPSPEVSNVDESRAENRVAEMTEGAAADSESGENRREKPQRAAGQSESATETESHEYSRSGSGSESGNSHPVTDENRETAWEFHTLPARRILLNVLSLHPKQPEQLAWKSDKPVRDLFARIQKPYFSIGTLSGFNSSHLQTAQRGTDWQGKALAQTGSNPALFGGFQALYAVPVGKFHLQSGVQVGMDLTPRRNTWNYTTRIVSDSFPYRNIPGDTLFWVPVRYRDTQMQVQTEMRMRSISIPLQWTRLIAFNPKSGIVLQGGVRLERWTVISGNKINPQNDRTWSQQQFAGSPYGTTARLDKTDIRRWQGTGNLGLGAYRRLNENLLLQGVWSTGTQFGGTGTAKTQPGMRQNFGYLHLQMLFTW